MTKRGMALLLVLCMALCLCACGKSDGDGTVTTTTTVTEGDTTTNKQNGTADNKVTTTVKQDNKTTVKTTSTTKSTGGKTTSTAKSTTTTTKPITTTTIAAFDAYKPDIQHPNCQLLFNSSEMGRIADILPFSPSSPSRGLFFITEDGSLYEYSFSGKFSTTQKPYRKLEAPTLKLKSFLHDPTLYPWRYTGKTIDNRVYSFDYYSGEIRVSDESQYQDDNWCVGLDMDENRILIWDEYRIGEEIYAFPKGEVVEKISNARSNGDNGYFSATVKTNKGYYLLDSELVKSEYVDIPDTYKIVSKKVEINKTIVPFYNTGIGIVLVDEKNNVYGYYR